MGRKLGVSVAARRLFFHCPAYVILGRSVGFIGAGSKFRMVALAFPDVLILEAGWMGSLVDWKRGGLEAGRGVERVDTVHAAGRAGGTSRCWSES